MKNSAWLVLALLASVWTSCQNPDWRQAEAQPAPGLLNVVVTTPAGTNHLRQLDAAQQAIVPVEEAGQEVTFPFAVAPGNWGFVPGSRQSDGSRPGPVEVLVLSETAPLGTVQEVVPLGLVKYAFNQHMHHLVVAVPSLEADRISSVRTRADMSGDLVFFLELWLLNHRGPGKINLFGWKNEAAALDYVRQALPQS